MAFVPRALAAAAARAIAAFLSWDALGVAALAGVDGAAASVLELSAVGMALVTLALLEGVVVTRAA